MEYPLCKVIRKFFQGLNIEKQSKNNSAIPDLDKRNKNMHPYKNLHMDAHGNIIHNRQKADTIQMPDS